MPMPIEMPMLKMLMARLCSARGNRSAMIELAAGVSAASPSPMPSLAAANWPNDFASPQHAVITHQKLIATPIRVRRL